jgi:hypothetical protein
MVFLLNSQLVILITVISTWSLGILAHPKEDQMVMSSPELIPLPPQVTMVNQVFPKKQNSKCVTFIGQVTRDIPAKQQKIVVGPLKDCTSGEVVDDSSSLTIHMNGVTSTASYYQQDPSTNSLVCKSQKSEIIFEPGYEVILNRAIV